MRATEPGPCQGLEGPDGPSLAGRAGDRSGPAVVSLDDPRAVDVGLTGAKAANLARARRAGLPGLGGFVLTTVATAAPNGSDDPDPAHLPELRAQWSRWSDDGARALVVRSSSVGEDTETSSMAGQFTSVLDVRGWPVFLDAVREVLRSATQAGGGTAEAMAVLVQRHTEARLGGVLFGLDPRTGDRRHLLVSMVEGSPDRIVSGEDDGTTVLLGRYGRVRSADGPLPASFGGRDRRALARLGHDAGRVFGGPQDVEWLIEPEGRLRLLQSRPVTAAAVPAERSHALGPGPVAETFPEPLSRLERDLWLPPLDDGIAEALRISGATGQRERYVVDVGGRVAVDLEVLGAVDTPSSFWRVLDPRPPLRRLRAAWRLGRLRVALPGIVDDLLAETDGHLAAVPPLDRLDDHRLLTVLRTTGAALAGLHAHEVLAGLLVAPGATATTGAAMATSTLRRDRLDGLDDDAIVARHPVVLALVPPRIGPPRPLPDLPDPANRHDRHDRHDRSDRHDRHDRSDRHDRHDPSEAVAVADVAARPDPTHPAGGTDRREPDDGPRPGDRSPAEAGAPDEVDDPMAVAREALRLRARWVQELQARAVAALADRLVHRGQLGALEEVRHLTVDELRALVEDPTRRATHVPVEPTPPPLPAVFRLTASGEVVADPGAAGARRGVSAGRARGEVSHDPADAAGRVLVVRNLDPGLAPALAGIDALVAETGSPLSHLAILAREHRVPTVVGYVGALDRLRSGDVVLVDGSTGEVEVLARAGDGAEGSTGGDDEGEVSTGGDDIDLRDGSGGPDGAAPREGTGIRGGTGVGGGPAHPSPWGPPERAGDEVASAAAAPSWQRPGGPLEPGEWP